MRPSTLSALALLALTALSCTLIGTPQPLVLPTVIPTAPPISLADLSARETVIDPVGTVTVARDPDLEALVNNVSQQNLLSYVQTLSGFGSRHIFSDTQRPDAGIGAARNWLFNEFNRVGNGRLIVTFDDFILPYAGRTSSQQNVVATLPGSSDHLGVIVLMAHYDSRGVGMDDGIGRAPGANDNASGVALMLEVARLMSARRWNQTVVFVAFSAEEQGRYGSRHYVQGALLTGQQIDAAINNDIVGGRPGIPQSIRVFSPGPDNSPSRLLARYLQMVGELYMPDFGIVVQDAPDREGRWSDHLTFIEAGLPAIRLTESVEDFATQHSGADTWDKLDYGYLMQVTQLNLAAIANMAGAPPPPPSPTVTAMADPGAFLLNWTPDTLAAGYAISFRPLAAPTYETTAFRYVNNAEAGNVAITGLDASQTYSVSLAAIDNAGRISRFSPEIVVVP